jgi:hypothetical protein
MLFQFGLLHDEDKSLQTSVVEKCLLLWREYSKELKNKDRIKMLDKALREMGKVELAEAVMGKYQDHQEITPDMFA